MTHKGPKPWTPTAADLMTITRIVQNGGNLVDAAQALRITDRTLHRRRRELPDLDAVLSEAVRVIRAQKWEHGGASLVGYKRYGCRCEICRRAATKDAYKKRKQRKNYPVARIPHGLSGYVNYDCRCSICKEAGKQEMARQISNRAQRVSDIPHGTASGWSFWRCRCNECRLAQNRKVLKSRQKSYSETLDTAIRRGFDWTGPELELASRTDLSDRQVALMLGRTTYGVRYARNQMKIQPKFQTLAGIKRWREVKAS